MHLKQLQFMKKIITLFLLFLICACTKEVNLNDIDVEQYIVVNSLFTSNEYLTVNICKTGANLLNPEITAITDARVILWNNNEIIEELTHDSVGYYSNKTYKLQEDKEYTITVDVKGFKQVKATDIIPKKVPVLNHNVELNNYILDYQTFSTLMFTFSDPLVTENYYIINIVFEEISNTDTNIYSTVIRSDDDFIFFDENNVPSFGLDSYFYLLFDDNNIDPQTTKTTINYFEINQTDSLSTKILKFHSVSKNMYLYYKSANILGVIRDEPIFNQTNYYFNLYSNVQNGIGIFAGYNTTIDTFLLNGEKYNCVELK